MSTDPSAISVQSSASLSPRECEVLLSIADGLTTKEIAALLNLSVKTIDTHREHLGKKLGSRNTALLTRHAIALGLVTVEIQTHHGDTEGTESGGENR